METTNSHMLMLPTIGVEPMTMKILLQQLQKMLTQCSEQVLLQKLLSLLQLKLQHRHQFKDKV